MKYDNTDIDGKRSGFLGNYQRDSALVEQAARETGIPVTVGPTLTMEPAAGWVGLYSPSMEDHGPFWKRLRELRDKHDQA